MKPKIFPVYYSRVYFGSSMPEFYLYDENLKYIGYWSEYHNGCLPKGLLPAALVRSA